jgi:membrane fusion protein, multidrug efflux system
MKTMMTPQKRAMCGRPRLGSALLLLLGAIACGRGGSVPAEKGVTTPTPGPVTIDIVRVVEQPLNVELSLPGELTPYQSVAIYPRVTGFVRTVRVDRGSRVRAGDVIATLEAPELLAQRSEAQSKLQAAEAQLAAARSKVDADRSTADKLKAASATPGVVAGNDVLIAEKAAEASQSQVAAGQQNVEAARQALNAVREMERYLQVTAPFAGVVTERNIHPGALVGPASGSGSTVPMVRLVDNSRLRLVVPVPEAYTAEMKAGTEIPFSVAASPGHRW